MKKYIMSLDQGTTSSRAILFDKCGKVVSMAQKEFAGIYPKEGWVEHDPMVIWSTEMAVATEALTIIGENWSSVIGIGITNQRETTIVWDRATGTPIYNAIVWQCRRTAGYCDGLKARGLEEMIRQKTGLMIDPYFSATKLAWILDNVEGAREKAEKGELCFGTVDSWLIWKMTGGKVHATDHSNASRTQLYNIHTGDWDDELLELFNIPRSILPTLMDSSGIFGYTDEDLFSECVPIAGVAGDQQAALFGQCCFDKGNIKNTYGTGAFLLMNAGDSPLLTSSGLISTVAWSIGGKRTFAIEGSVFTAGAAIGWLRDGLRIIDSSYDSEYYASKVEDCGGVVVVPAFTGLGAPYWDPYARGMIIGINRATTKNHIIRATLESLAFQTADVVELMEKSSGVKVERLSVDGGASQNSLLLKIQSDVLGIQIERPMNIETTALGAAYLCGLALGVYSSKDEIRDKHQIELSITPEKDNTWREDKFRVWRKAVSRSLEWIE